MKDDTPSLSGSIARREGREATRSFRGGPGKGALFRPRRAWKSAPDARQKLRDEERLPVLLELLKDYCQNSSLVGFKYITEVHRTWFERVKRITRLASRSSVCDKKFSWYWQKCATRGETYKRPRMPAIMWISLHLVVIVSMGTVVWKVLLEYKHTPVSTEVESHHYPSKSLDFPAVSVCSINRISRRAAVRLAELIKLSNITDLEINEIVPLLYGLGNLYDSSFNMRCDNEKVLDALLQKYFRGQDNLTETMKELTPRCKDMFLWCRFRAKEKNCSELFSLRKTQDGFCCTFNYARESDDLQRPGAENRVGNPYKIKKLGKENGLTFLIESSLDDDFFSILPINGWKIIIFNSDDYPDNTSGSILNSLISPGTENFLELDAISFFSEKSVRSFDVKERNCIFNDEITALFNDYTFSDCVVDCKLDDMWRSYNCRPLFLPKALNFGTINQSLVHIFFSKYATVRLKQDITYYWYELLSDIGGLCSVFIGFSLISIAELLYYIILLGGMIRLSHNKPISNDNNAEEKETDLQSIYWSELAPRKLLLKHAKVHKIAR